MLFLWGGLSGKNFFSVDETQLKGGKIFHLALTLYLFHMMKKIPLSCLKKKVKTCHSSLALENL